MSTTRPTGTVTFLFTDIEGSTQLWENHPEWMARAHLRQEELLRAAFEKHGGYTYKMIGDAFQVAFGSAPAAVAAAIDAQRALHAEPWGETEIRVRMALHSGETSERGDDYVGPLLNRVARLMSAGHGGQVLLTQSTCELVRDRLPATIRLRDMGERRLRDLNRPERVHQLVVSGLRQDFPPLKTLDAHPNNLPVQLTHFIGREQPIGELAQILGRSRLVTLTGSGDSGKTRLALQLGGELLDRFEHGVWFVELAPLTDEHEVPQAVATALGVEEAAERPVIEALLARVAGEERLVILDNCEHLMNASIQLVTALLRASPRSRVLATSREPLRVAGEATYRVPSLAIPDPTAGATLATLASSEAVRLFADRAVNVTSSFVLTDASVPIVAEICRRLDGIPLAIELAAARVVSLSVERLAERLSDRFRLLARGDRAALPRQQTLRALIDWSHELLNEPERVLLRRLAVFAGSFSLDAAEAVCAGGEVDELDVLDLLTNLVEKSLVAMEPGSERFRLLETIREYAHERLGAAHEEIAVRDRHLAHYLTRAEQASETFRSGETVRWKALEIDHENFMAAHAWCDQGAGHVEDGLRLMLALRDYWYARGMLEPGLRVGIQAISRPGAEARTLLRCRALHEVARLHSWLFQGGDAERFATESLEIARELGANDRAAIALRQLGMLAQFRKDGATALARVQEAISLARGLADPFPLTMALSSLAEIQRTRGDLAAAEPLYEESLAIARKFGDRLSISIDLLNLAALHVDRGSPARAVAPLREGLTTLAEASLKAIGQYGLDVSAALASVREEWPLAARLYGGSEAYRLQIGISRDPVDVEFVARHVARVREALGEEAYSVAETAGRGLRYEEVLAEARRWLEGLEGSGTT